MLSAAASSTPMSLLLLRMLLLLAVASAVPDGRCLTKCGDVEIPYPFGIGHNCSLAEGFSLICNTVGGLKKPFYGNVEVLNISLTMGQVRMLNHISSACYYPNHSFVSPSEWTLNMAPPYRFSDLRNKFTVIGCHTLAYIVSRQDNSSYQSGCVSMCQNKKSLTDGSCSGVGCCQTSIPKNLTYYSVTFDNAFRNQGNWGFGNCSYAVLLEAESFQFHTSYITTNQLMKIYSDGWAPVVMDWAIGHEKCEVASHNLSSYACISNNSECIDSSNGPGYLCNCSTGYQGNPYVSNGCQDIDECNQQSNPCSDGICQNLPGNYSCHCPDGTHGDAYNGTCIPNQKLSLAVKAVIGTSISLTFLLVFGMCICMIYQRRKLIQSRKRYFSEHGGMELREEMRKLGLAFRIFSNKELERAINRVDKISRILGEGGYGIVYKGDIGDNQFVAIKKPKLISERKKKEFGKEMLILSQVNHKNIVKLLGCCLDVEVPMLVYEFVPNGNLFELIHSRIDIDNFTLAVRLNIACDSADALAYLHSSASPPIIHGDVKSANILLHENFTAKISDFGFSRLNPKDKEQFATFVQGTHGYLDPEFVRTGKFTEKSDVYSFGVVLLELLTRKKAIYFDENGEETYLASSFILPKKEDRLEEHLDNQGTSEEDEQLIERIGELAVQCLSARGEERPTMKDVADQLNNMRKFKQHSWTSSNAEDIQIFHPVTSDAQTSTSNTSCISEVSLRIECAR